MNLQQINPKTNIKIIAEYLYNNTPNMTEMKLYKMLYFAQKTALAITFTKSLGKEPKILFTEQLNAWKYGAVYVPLRKEFNKSSIFDYYQKNQINKSAIKLNSLEELILDECVNIYGYMSAFTLAELNHKDGAWQKAKKGSKAISYNDLLNDAEHWLDMISDYSEHEFDHE